MADTHERAFIAEQELEGLTRDAAWLDWATKVLEEAERKRQ